MRSDGPKIKQSAFVGSRTDSKIFILLIASVHVAPPNVPTIKVNNGTVIAHQTKIQLSEVGGIGDGKRFAEVNCGRRGVWKFRLGVDCPIVNRTVSKRACPVAQQRY